MSEPIKRYKACAWPEKNFLLEVPDGPLIEWADHERIVSALQAALEVMAARVGEKQAGMDEPVAWRVRGYAQFKTGSPGPWRYVDGPTRPPVNNPDCCDLEPLYAQSAEP